MTKKVIHVEFKRSLKNISSFEDLFLYDPSAQHGGPITAEIRTKDLCGRIDKNSHLWYSLSRNKGLEIRQSSKDEKIILPRRLLALPFHELSNLIASIEPTLPEHHAFNTQEITHDVYPKKICCNNSPFFLKKELSIAGFYLGHCTIGNDDYSTTKPHNNNFAIIHRYKPQQTLNIAWSEDYKEILKNASHAYRETTQGTEHENLSYVQNIKNNVKHAINEARQWMPILQKEAEKWNGKTALIDRLFENAKTISGSTIEHI